MQDILDDVFRMIELKSCLYFQRDFHAPWAMAVEGPDMAQFHIILDGRASVETAEGTEVLGAGDIVLFPRGTSVVERLAEVLLVQVLRRYFALNPAPGDFLAGVMDKRLSRAIAKIHADFDEPLTLTGLAEQAGMSRSGFAEHFRTVTGLAPLQYVTRWRMLSAEKFLHDPDLSVPDVAMRAGYDSDISFARAFKRTFGVTPAKYRQQTAQPSVSN